MSTPGPVLGPCESWITGDDVAACCSTDAGSDLSVFDDVAVSASMLLYELSGQQFSGLCETTVRPCGDGCSCWIPGRYLFWAEWSWGGWGWYDNRCRSFCGCQPLRTIKLAGYPVREISEVTIDGDVVDPATYRLDRWRELVRLDDPGPPVVQRRWPLCQNLALEDGPGTFFVTYTHGVSPPPIALSAAAELACQLWRSCNGDACSLPSGVTRVERQGITINREAILGALSTGNSGLLNVDAFLAVYGTPKRKAAVWSPDVLPFPRRVT
jgi:hypothetical protein